MENLNAPRNIEFKIKYDPDGIDNLKQLVSHMRETMNETQTFETCLVPNAKLIKALEAEFDCTAREGITGGCYGARDGKDFEQGLTVWMSPEELPDRWLDSEGDEIVNFWHLLNESGTFKGQISDEVSDSLKEALNLRIENSCNYMGHDSEIPHALFDIVFHSPGYESEAPKIIAIVSFHCGGDVRGNYTSDYLFEFDSTDDLYSAISPRCELKEEVES